MRLWGAALGCSLQAASRQALHYFFKALCCLLTLSSEQSRSVSCLHMVYTHLHQLVVPQTCWAVFAGQKLCRAGLLSQEGQQSRGVQCLHEATTHLVCLLPVPTFVHSCA